MRAASTSSTLKPLYALVSLSMFTTSTLPYHCYMVQAALSRDRYHHGDLHHALLLAGLELAREGGPDAVVLREATRRVGVSPNAAYRHFADRDALLTAVSVAAQAMLAEAIEAEFDRAAPTKDAAATARAHLRAIGTAYVRFALDNPGLIPRGFHGSGRPGERREPERRRPERAHRLRVADDVAG